VQVDERIAPAGDPDRNFTHLRESLLEHAPLPETQIYAMPVEESDASHTNWSCRHPQGKPSCLHAVYFKQSKIDISQNVKSPARIPG
jgi:6-phosphogluconolactonase/glucosamine-6-phosphate isomerase/deaminase